MPTLKEKVEELKKTVTELKEVVEGLSKISSFESSQEVINEGKEEIRKKIDAGITGIENTTSRIVGAVPEILMEFCRTLEEELGVNLVSLEKKIKDI